MKRCSSIMLPETQNYIFKTDINSVYQSFWVKHDLLEIYPDAELNFITKGKITILSITNSALCLTDIQLIFNENLIAFEKISH